MERQNKRGFRDTNKDKVSASQTVPNFKLMYSKAGITKREINYYVHSPGNGEEAGAGVGVGVDKPGGSRSKTPPVNIINANTNDSCILIRMRECF